MVIFLWTWEIGLKMYFLAKKCRFWWKNVNFGQKCTKNRYFLSKIRTPSFDIRVRTNSISQKPCPTRINSNRAQIGSISTTRSSTSTTKPASSIHPAESVSQSVTQGSSQKEERKEPFPPSPSPLLDRAVQYYCDWDREGEKGEGPAWPPLRSQCEAHPQRPRPTLSDLSCCLPVPEYRLLCYCYCYCLWCCQGLLVWD